MSYALVVPGVCGILRWTVLPILADTYGSNHARRWWVYWGVFFVARADRGYRNGEEWFVSHYMFGRP